MFPNLAPFSIEELRKIEKLLKEHSENASGFDISTLNYRNTLFFSHKNEAKNLFSENFDQRFHGYGYPGKNAAYCLLYLIFATQDNETNEQRFMHTKEEYAIQLAYRCAITIMHHKMKQYMLWSYSVSHAIEAFVLHGEFFYIDYFAENHPRKRLPIHKSWHDCKVFHKRLDSMDDYYTRELEYIQEWQKTGQQVNGKKYTHSIDHTNLKSKCRFIWLENAFYHIKE